MVLSALSKKQVKSPDTGSIQVEAELAPGSVPGFFLDAFRVWLSATRGDQPACWRSQVRSVLASIAPARCAATAPFLNSISVGMPRML